MLKEHGIVVEVKDQFAIVQTQTSNSCAQCAANQGCGTASLAAVFGQKVSQVKALNHKGAKVGEQVVIGLEEPALFKSCLTLYLLPILSMFVAAIGYDMLVTSIQLPQYEVLTVLMALLGLLAGLGWAKHVMGKMSEDRRYQPIVLQTE